MREIESIMLTLHIMIRSDWTPDENRLYGTVICSAMVGDDGVVSEALDQ